MGNRLKKLKLVAKRTCAGLTIYKNTYGTDNMTFFFCEDGTTWHMAGRSDVSASVAAIF